MTTPTTQPSPEYLKIPEVAKLLRVSTKTTRKLVASGRIPVLRIGTRMGEIRIRKTDIDAMFEKQKEAAHA